MDKTEIEKEADEYVREKYCKDCSSKNYCLASKCFNLHKSDYISGFKAAEEMCDNLSEMVNNAEERIIKEFQEGKRTIFGKTISEWNDIEKQATEYRKWIPYLSIHGMI